ncbi:H+/Cl-antiporter ClcA [Thiohalomonas denitrificans]|uniref:H+/Cl-antiporter ClcA n=2 Tax=Thiohalomonas denitrificans TaxID=415747 RepID=A0A1G5PQ71_9GAMM|nr:H+/Cl-antiporter ClcA [Thiohalomonas denitrificans]
MIRMRIFSSRKLFSSAAWQIRMALWGGAVLVGVVAILFAEMADGANHIFAAIVHDYPLAALVLSPLGLMAITWLTRHYFQGAEGSGIPQTLAALDPRTKGEMQNRILSVRVAVGKILMATLGLLSGASIGREGPTVHIGAAIMFSLGRWVKYPPHYLQRALILSGGAAGIAAAFNTPLAGVVFAIEEISRSFEENTSGVMLTGVIFAGMTALILAGNYTYFGSTDVLFTYGADWIAIPVCGVAGGLLGGIFSQILISGSRRLVPFYRAHPLWLAGLCGLAVAVIGLLSGNLTYGTGYAEAQQIISEGEQIAPAYPFLKMLATIASYLSGIPGGIFAPSLAAGAGLGADLATLMPGISATAIIILGMAAYFTGVVQTPITAFVIVMEMTDNQEMLLPLMATAFIANGVSRLVCPTPIYRALATAFLEVTAPKVKKEPPLPADFRPDLEEESGTEPEQRRTGRQD